MPDPAGSNLFDDPLPPATQDISEDEGAIDIDAGFNADNHGEEMEEEMVAQEAQRSNKARQAEKNRPQEKMLEADELDPWEAYDPHDASEVVLKPYKKGIACFLPYDHTGKTYKIPLSLKKTKGGMEKPTAPAPVKSNSNVSFLLRPAYPEFRYLYDMEMKRRRNAMKEERKQKLAKVELPYFYSPFVAHRRRTRNKKLRASSYSLRRGF